jgi:hypothetical protein
VSILGGDIVPDGSSCATAEPSAAIANAAAHNQLKVFMVGDPPYLFF